MPKYEPECQPSFQVSKAEIEVIQMKTTLFFAFFTFFLSTVSPSDATDFMSLANGISIKSVNVVRISESPDVLKVILTFNNENKQKIRIREGRFQVIINPKNEPPMELSENEKSLSCLKDMISNLGGGSHIFPDSKLNLGKTNPINNFEIEGCIKFDEDGRCEKPGQRPVQTDIPLPRSLMEKEQIIYKLINYLGLPAANKAVSLLGDVRVEVKEEGKWIYQKLKLELYYKPKVQSESLFVGW